MKKIAIIFTLLLAACSEPEPEIIYNDIYIDPVYDDALEIVGISKQQFDGNGGNAEFLSECICATWQYPFDSQ